MTKVRELPQEALLIQDSQDRKAVAESVGLPGSVLKHYPTLFVLVGNAEIDKVWGIESFVPYAEETVFLLYDRQRKKRTKKKGG